MNGLNKTNFTVALDRTCKLDENACRNCKVDRATSELHKTITAGLTWAEIMKMQRKEV